MKIFGGIVLFVVLLALGVVLSWAYSYPFSWVWTEFLSSPTGLALDQREMFGALLMVNLLFILYKKVDTKEDPDPVVETIQALLYAGLKFVTIYVLWGILFLFV